MILSALAWSGEVWAVDDGYTEVSETKTVSMTDTKLQSLVSSGGYFEGNVTFKLSGNYDSDHQYIEIGGKGTKYIYMTAQDGYTIESVIEATVAACSYKSSKYYEKYVSLGSGTREKVGGGAWCYNSAGNYKSVSSTSVNNPITINCTCEGNGIDYSFYLNSVSIKYSISHIEEILYKITVKNRTNTSTTNAGVATQGTATADEPQNGYEFLGWTIPEGVTLTEGTSLSKTIKFHATAQGTITANYGPIYDVTVANNVDATTSTVQAGTIKTANVTASDKTNYEFHQWDIPTGVGLTNNTTINNTTITIQATAENKTITAKYKPVFLFSPTAVPSNESLGTATVEVTNRVVGNVGANSYTTTATFTAEPKTDCVFLGWFTTNSYKGEPVSTDLSHTETLTSTIGTPGTKTLYALFKKKQNLKWVDEDLELNLVLGAENLSSAAFVTSNNKTITYTSSNENALTIATDGAITTIGLGNSTVTAHVDGDDVYRAETITREFNVGERKQATFTPSWGESLSTDIELGETATITLKNVNANFSVTKGEGNYFSWEQTNSNTITITALSAGSTTLTLSQPGDGAYLDGNTTTYTINVVKHPNTFTLAAESKAMKVGEDWTNVVTNTGNNNTQVSYSDDDIATYDATENKITAIAEGSTIITFTQAATTTYAGLTKTIEVTVTKVTNTLSISLPSQAVFVDETIKLQIPSRNNSAAIVGTITNDQLATSVNEGTDVITFDSENNSIIAKNAGTATITFSQPETNKYTASQEFEFDITVSKINNSLTFTLANESATSIRLKSTQTVTLNISSTNKDTEPFVNRTGSSTSYSNGTITALSTEGTDIYEITQAETYKYKRADAYFTVWVNNTDEEVGYVLYDDNEYSHGAGKGLIGNKTFTISGPVDSLSYSATRETLAAYYNLYVDYKKKDGTWVYAAHNNTDIDDGKRYKPFGIRLPEDACEVQFRLENNLGTLTKYVKDIKAYRKTYVSASANITDWGTVYTNQVDIEKLPVTVKYSSTNGGDIHIVSSNPNFVPDIEEIKVDVNKKGYTSNNTPYIAGVDGTVTFYVTYTPDPDKLGPEYTDIEIRDLFHTTTVTMSATARKVKTTIQRGSNTATSTNVGETINNAFNFSGTTQDYPSDNNSDDFYYTISHMQTSNVNNGDGVIDYDPVHNTITGLNAGTATLTIYQKNTNHYSATSQQFEFSVSKSENNMIMALSTRTLNVDGTATVQLMSADSDGALSATYSNINYLNESQNRDGGLLSFAGNTLTGVNAGTGKVIITQAETYKYVAKSQEFNVTVNKLTQTLSWDNPDLETTMQVGTTLEGNTATSDADLTPVTYSSRNASAITVDANTGVLTAVTTGSNIGVTASQAGNYKYLPATLTRQFSVFNKQTPAFNADSHFSGSTGRIEYSLTATITVTGVSDGVNGDFTITNGDNTIIDVVRDGKTITITGLKEGSTTLTLAQTANDDYLAKTQTYNIEVYWPDDFLALSPSSKPSSYTAGTYRKVFFNRSFNAGYSTIALPFQTTLEALTGGRRSADDWVAQLSVVTYTVADNGKAGKGYTLYFKETGNGADADGGIIEANRPYVLHLSDVVTNPVWENQVVLTPSTSYVVQAEKGYGDNGSGDYRDWKMHSNYNPTFEMEGYYGIVGDKIKKGADGSSLKAFRAYIEGPASAQVKAAYLDEDNADGLLEVLYGEVSGTESVYDLQGRKLPKAQRGLNIIRGADGSVKKVMSK